MPELRLTDEGTFTAPGPVVGAKYPGMGRREAWEEQGTWVATGPIPAGVCLQKCISSCSNVSRGGFAWQQLYRIYMGEVPQSAGRRVSGELRDAGHVQAFVGTYYVHIVVENQRQKTQSAGKDFACMGEPSATQKSVSSLGKKEEGPGLWSWAGFQAQRWVHPGPATPLRPVSIS